VGAVPGAAIRARVITLQCTRTSESVQDSARRSCHVPRDLAAVQRPRPAPWAAAGEDRARAV